jgi:hypothetical protein
MRARDADLEAQLRDTVRKGLEEQSAAFERYAGMIHEHLTPGQFREITDATFGAFVRIVSHALRLLRDGANGRGPNSRVAQIPRLASHNGPTLHRVR